MDQGWTKGLTLGQASSVFGSLMNMNNSGPNMEDLKDLQQRDQRFFCMIFHFIMHFVHIRATNRQLCLFNFSTNKQYFKVIMNEITKLIKYNESEHLAYKDNCNSVYDFLNCKEMLGSFSSKNKKDMPDYLIDINYSGFNFVQMTQKTYKQECSKGTFTVEDYRNKDKGGMRGILPNWPQITDALGMDVLLGTNSTGSD